MVIIVQQSARREDGTVELRHTRLTTADVGPGRQVISDPGYDIVGVHLVPDEIICQLH